MKKCPICDGNNNDSANRCEYCDYDFKTELDTNRNSNDEISHSKYETLIEPSNMNTSVTMKQNKINAYFEGDDEYENKEIFQSPVPVIESDGRIKRMVPILVAVIILLCLSIILLLLYFHDFKKNSNKMTDNVSIRDNTPTVSSEIPKVVEVNQETEINEKSVTLSIKEFDQFVEEINEVPQNSIKNLTKDEVYSRYIDIINSMDYYKPFRGFLVDLNADNINELIVPDVEDLTYQIYYCDDTDVKSIKFGAFMSESNFTLYKVEGDDSENYIYYRDNYGYKSEQGYFSLDYAAEINIYLKFPYEDEGTATWNVSYNKTSLFAEGSEYVYGLYGETKQCYAQILAAFQKYRFGISDNSNYVSINGLYYDELLDELRSYN